MKLRTLVFWPHLIAGVSAGVVILLMCVTGALLTYERQLIAWSDSHFRSAPPSPDAARLPMETLLARVQAAHPDLAPTAVTVRSAPDAPVVLAVPRRTLYADAYTGAVLGEGTQTVRRLMSSLRAWHRWIGVQGDAQARAVPKAITGWSNVIFAFIVASGFYLWFPRKWAWNQVRAVVLFNSRARGKARDFNWHNVIGSWSAAALFIVVISGVPISFSWGNALVYRLVGEEVPRPAAAAGRQGGAAGRNGGPGARAGGPGRVGGPGAAAPVATEAVENVEAPGDGQPRGRSLAQAPARDDSGLNALMARAERQVPGWRSINMRLPTSTTGSVVFAIDRGDGGQPQLRSTLTLDRASGEIVRYEAFSDLTRGRQIRNVMRFAHTGEVLGIPGQTIAGLVSAGGAVLVWTGIALALRRLIAWRRRRTNRPDVIPVRANETAA
jgi:uncharacterized iron-regulated membrane protein